MTTTRTNARKLLTELIEGPLRTFTATGGSATTVVSATLARWAENDNAFAYWYLGMTKVAGSATWESRPIKRTGGYVASTTTATVTDAYGGNIANADTGELHRYDPDYKHTALNLALDALFRVERGDRVTRGLYLPVVDDTLVVDNLLTNGTLDVFSTTFTGWSNIGTPTLALETTRKLFGDGSASITASGATEGIEQNIYSKLNVREAVGKTLYVDGFVWASTASVARIRVTFDGSTYTDGTYHQGDAEWEGRGSVGIQATIPADATECTVSCEVADGSTAYFTGMAAYVLPVYTYSTPSSIDEGPFEIQQQVQMEDPHSPYWPIGPRNPPRAGHRLRLIGIARLTEFGTTAGDEADTTEADGEQMLLVAHKAAEIFCRAMSNSPTTEDADFFARQATVFQRTVDEGIAHGVLKPWPLEQKRNGVWTRNPDGTTKQFILGQWRG